MKTALFIRLAALSLVLAGFLPFVVSAQEYDDIYYVPGDEVYERRSQNESSYAEDSYDDHYQGDQPSEADAHVDEQGNTYITNNYNGNNSYDDYYYTGRIRRFRRNSFMFNYYSGFYANPWVNYNWWSPGFSLNWGWGPSSYYGFNQGFCNPWRNPWAGGYYRYSYWPNWSYYNGFDNGYYVGYWDGFNDRYYNPYPYYYSPYHTNNPKKKYSGDDGGRSQYYGHRSSRSTNSGRRDDYYRSVNTAIPEKKSEATPGFEDKEMKRVTPSTPGNMKVNEDAAKFNPATAKTAEPSVKPSGVAGGKTNLAPQREVRPGAPKYEVDKTSEQPSQVKSETARPVTPEPEKPVRSYTEYEIKERSSEPVEYNRTNRSYERYDRSPDHYDQPSRQKTRSYQNNGSSSPGSYSGGKVEYERKSYSEPKSYSTPKTSPRKSYSESSRSYSSPSGYSPSSRGSVSPSPSKSGGSSGGSYSGGRSYSGSRSGGMRPRE